MDHFRNFLATALICLTCAAPALAATKTTVLLPPTVTDSLPGNLNGRRSLLCDLVNTAILQTPDNTNINFGDNRIISKYTLNDKQLSWDAVSWYDFYRTFPERSAEIKKSGKVFGQDYAIRTAHLDINGDSHREDLYQAITPHGAPLGPIFISGNNGALTQIIESLQPDYVVNYQSVPYLVTRNAGIVGVYRLQPNPVVSSKRDSNIIASPVCTLADPHPPSVEGTESHTLTTPVDPDGSVFK